MANDIDAKQGKPKRVLISFSQLARLDRLAKEQAAAEREKRITCEPRRIGDQACQQGRRGIVTLPKAEKWRNGYKRLASVGASPGQAKSNCLGRTIQRASARDEETELAKTRPRGPHNAG